MLYFGNIGSPDFLKRLLVSKTDFKKLHS